MVLDRFILQEAVKKAYQVGTFGGHILVLWTFLPFNDAILYSGYTCVAFVIYSCMILTLYTSGELGNENAIPFRKQIAGLFPLVRVIVED
jgi:hypothetical protein